MKPFALALAVVVGLAVPLAASAAQPSDPSPPEPVEADRLAPASDPLGQPPSTPPPIAPSDPPIVPPVAASTSREATPIAPEREEEPEMSEGRRIVVAWNTGFQWGIAPGIFFSGGKTSFALGLRLGYGIDTGSVILVPGLRLAGYFSDPGVYLGMPVMKLVLPIDRFAPFVEAGAGAGYVSKGDATPAQTGVAMLAGGGFMIHFTMRFGLGVEANYQLITGSDFKGFGIGPILALAF